jgi:hypothetical protein
MPGRSLACSRCSLVVRVSSAPLLRRNARDANLPRSAAQRLSPSLCRHRAKEPKVKASSKPSKTLEESQKIKCLLDNPKTRGMKPYNRYEKYKFATTVKEFYEKGGTPAYLKYDIGRGFIEVIQGKAPTSLVSDSDTCDEGDCHGHEHKERESDPSDSESKSGPDGRPRKPPNRYDPGKPGEKASDWRDTGDSGPTSITKGKPFCPARPKGPRPFDGAKACPECGNWMHPSLYRKGKCPQENCDWKAEAAELSDDEESTNRQIPAPPLRAKGILTFDVEDKIKALFEEREWLSGIGVRSVPMMSDTDVRKTLDIKPKERLEHFLEKLMDTKEYASVVGAAIFISTACRPDIAQAISRVSRAMHKKVSFHTPFKVEEMTPRDVSDLFSGKKKSLNDKNKNN